MPRRHWFVVAGLIALGHQTAANAFWPLCGPRRTPPMMLPASPNLPGTATPPSYLPPTANPAVDPANPNPPVLPPTAAMPPGQGPGAAAAPGGNDFLGGQAASTFNPNMFGDFFGGAGRTRSLVTPTVTQFAGNGSLTLTPSHPLDGDYAEFSSVTGFDPKEAGATIQLLLNGYGSRSISGAELGGTNVVTQKVTYPVPSLVPGNTTFAVNSGTTNVFTEVVDRLAATPAGRQILLAALNDLAGRRSGQLLTVVDSLRLGPVGQLNVRTNDTSDLIYFYQVIARGLGTVPYELGISIANPADGGNVGRTKTSEDNSPFPRDRVFFNYDYYSATRLTADGLNVNRFSAGVEMTFLDRQASVEVRVPFASTLSSTISLDGMTGRDVELGNVAVSAKWLWTRDPVINFASGLTVALPTANDTVLNLSDGSELLRVKNQTALLSPYVAMSYTPNDRLFSQSWASLGFDPAGNDVRLRNFADGSVQTQKVYAVPIFSADTQLGYWVARNADAGAALQGLAPFVELHYNRGANFGRQNARFNGVNVVEARTNFDDFNLTAGFVAHLRGNLLISNGLVVPLGERQNRFFDWQYGLRMNWLYGPTADATDAAMAAIRAKTAGQGGAAPAFVPPGSFSKAEPAKNDVTAVQHTEAAAPSPMQQTLAAAPCGSCAASPETPPFFGDFVGIAGRRTVMTAAGPRTVRVPLIPQMAGLKVTDNDGPRPTDRVYFTYNGIDNAFGRQNPSGLGGADVTRETVGFEKTIFGGYGSVGARLPFVQQRGNGLDDLAVGDLTLVAKLAWAQDAETGSLIASGVNLTLPTGDPADSALLNDGRNPPRALWLQPWTGYVLNGDRFYTQGVVSLAAPSEDAYPVELFTSVAAGYWLVRSETGDIRGLVPTVELHANTPLTNRGGGRRVTALDEANLTAGLNVLLPKMTLGGAVSFPVLGQSAYRVEALATVNFRF